MVKNSEREPGAKGGHFQALSSVSLKMGTSFLSLSKLKIKVTGKGSGGHVLQMPVTVVQMTLLNFRIQRVAQLASGHNRSGTPSPTATTSERAAARRTAGRFRADACPSSLHPLLTV